MVDPAAWRPRLESLKARVQRVQPKPSPQPAAKATVPKAPAKAAPAKAPAAKASAPAAPASPEPGPSPFSPKGDKAAKPAMKRPGTTGPRRLGGLRKMLADAYFSKKAEVAREKAKLEEALLRKVPEKQELRSVPLASRRSCRASCWEAGLGDGL